MLHKTSQERYDKLHAQFIRLMKHFDKDGLDDFMQTANSLTDWIRRDPTLNQHQKAGIERFTVYNGIDWQICNQIANFQKHSGSTSPRRKSAKSPALAVKDAHVKKDGNAGIVFPEMKMRTFGAGEVRPVKTDPAHSSGLRSKKIPATGTFFLLTSLFIEHCSC